MGDYKKITIFLNDQLYKEILDIVEYRNKRIIVDNEDSKATNVEEFVTGSVIQVLKWIKSEEVSAGFDDLGKPYRLRNHFKEILKGKGWNQKMLAEKTNIDPGNISIILNNRSQASLDYFLRIWIALGCPPINECLSRVEKED
jgi:DNA-binding Xre family transcriptional regulator